MSGRVDFDAVRRANPISEVVRRYVSLRRVGHAWMGCCPFHDDRTPSLAVSDAKEKFNCFGCGAHGDVVDFVRLKEGVDARSAAEIIASQTATYASAVPTKPSKGLSDTVGFARHVWDAGRNIVGTLAEKYLESRGLPLAALPTLPDLRFAYLKHPKLPGEHPTLIAAVRDLYGGLQGIQRTFLNAQGRKLSGVNAKLSLGSIRGNAIKLGEGIEEIIVCEGLEDGLSVWTQHPEASVWVCAGAGMMSSLVLPLGCHSVLIASDNDEAGQRAAYEAERAFQRRGVATSVAYPSPNFKDFNEMLVKGATDD